MKKLTLLLLIAFMATNTVKPIDLKSLSRTNKLLLQFVPATIGIGIYAYQKKQADKIDDVDQREKKETNAAIIAAASIIVSAVFGDYLFEEEKKLFKRLVI